MAKKQRRLNFYFRQTARQFKATKQASVFAKVKRTLPYTILNLSRSLFKEQLRKIKWQESKARDGRGTTKY